MHSARAVPPTLKMRQRNKAEEKFLDKRLTDIELDYRSQNGRLITEIAELKNTLMRFNVDGGDHCLEYFGSPEEPSKPKRATLLPGNHKSSSDTLNARFRPTKTQYNDSLGFTEQDNLLDGDTVTDLRQSHDLPNQCSYGSGIKNLRCQHFPCAVPRTYHSIGYQIITREYPNRPVAPNQLHVSKDTGESDQENSVPVSVDKESALTAPEFQERTAKQGRPSIREKVQSLKQVLDKRKRKLAETKPKAWVTNYGNPVPLRRIMNPLRPAPSGGEHL